MKKIIIATDAWAPQVNGVVKCVEKIKEYLEKNDFHVTIIHPGLFVSAPLFFYPEIRLSFFPKNKIKKIIKETNPDYIHIVTEGPIGFATRTICLREKIKFTTANHTQFQVYFKYYFGLEWKLFVDILYLCLRWFHNKSNGTMVITKELKENLEKRGFFHVLLWPLGVDTDLFRRNEKISVEDYGFTPPVFMYFGRISNEKNVEGFLKLSLPGTKLVIGDGPLKSKLEEKYGKEAVFTGLKTGKDLVDLLSVSDVFVFPSLTDVFPLAIIEAFSCGIPVAAHDVMDLKYLVKSNVGVLDEDLAKAAMGCLNISREKCREYAMNFSWEKSIKKFVNNLVEIK